MAVFGAYSRYYNLFYKDKDYAGEAAYIYNIIKKYCPGTKSVLDLGCGTGRHALQLAEMQLEVTGVDISRDMLDVANASLSARGTQESSCDFQQGDIRTVRLGRSFDVVISLFHVISYQTSNDDLRAAFATVRNHLEPGGIFIFDCWYGPAVLTDRPVVRVKRLEDSAIAVTRIVEPVMHANDNLVDLNYQILVKDKSNDAVEDLKETHHMRYFFRPEIELLLQDAGLSLADSFEWMSSKPTGFDTWGACFVARA